MTSGFIVDRNINGIIALADLIVDNNGISRISNDPLLTNKILEQMNFDTWNVTIFAGYRLLYNTLF